MDFLAQMAGDFQSMLPWLMAGPLVGGLMSGLPSFVRRGIFNYGLPLAAAQQQSQQQEEARGMTEQRYQDALQEYQNLRHQIPQLRQLGSDITGGYEQLGQQGRQDLYGMASQVIPQFQAGREAEAGILGDYGRNVVGGYQDRLQRNLANLEGFGQQARQDIGRTYDEARNVATTQLAERGLGGSTLLNPVIQANERERTDALGRLNEDLRREAIGLDVGLSGDLLGAQERGTGLGLDIERSGRGALTDFLQGFGTNLTNLGQQAGLNTLQAQERTGLMPIEYQTQLAQLMNSIRAGRNDIPPDQGFYASLMQGLGGASAPKAEMPSMWQNVAGQALGTGGGMGLGYGLASLFGF